MSLTTDRVVIVGAGLGALYAALELAPCPVLVISPEILGEGASSAWAQGGVAAAMASNDTAEDHALDTMRAGAGTVDAAVARMVTADARAHILDLTAIGTPFDRDAQGGYVLSREAAHGLARVVRVRGDQSALDEPVGDAEAIQNVQRGRMERRRPEILGKIPACLDDRGLDASLAKAGRSDRKAKSKPA